MVRIYFHFTTDKKIGRITYCNELSCVPIENPSIELVVQIMKIVGDQGLRCKCYIDGCDDSIVCE